MNARLVFEYSPDPTSPRRALPDLQPREAAELDMAYMAVMTRRLGLHGTWSIEDATELPAPADFAPASAATDTYRMVRPSDRSAT